MFNTAAEHGIAIVFPDTSPRGAGAPGEEDDWDFGTGAGFYIDATAKGFEKYKMYTLLTEELPAVLKEANLGLVRMINLRQA
jgi:S-formylglutathione hydrolase